MEALTLEFVRDKETFTKIRFKERVESGQEPRLVPLYFEKDVVGAATRLVIRIEEVK